MIEPRWCPACQRRRSPDAFRSPGDRDCLECVGKRRVAAVRIARMRALEGVPMTGVDIDAIHYKRGAVSKKLLHSYRRRVNATRPPGRS